MRLLNTTTLKLQEFFRPPPYVILSHRWSEEEVSYEDFVLARRNSEQLPSYLTEEATEIRQRKGYRKILDFAAKAGEHLNWETGKPFEWCWLDTCCIDKRSSSELSEAINSMWNWYKNSGFCVVYLKDILSSADITECGERLQGCNWFTRCWTLQELLAPQKLSFFDSEWVALLSVYKAGYHEDGANWCWWSKDGSSAAEALGRATRIPESVLARGRMDTSEVCVAQKMSWAAHRCATREEDVAYSLLGLFGVNMPLLYGEGSKAFLRLQHEILRHIDDSSIFAWQSAGDERAIVPTACPHYLCESTSLLASSPRLFQDSGALRKNPRSTFRIHITNSAVYMDVEAPVRRVVHTLDKVRRFSPRIPWYVLELGYYDDRDDKKRLPCRLVIWRDTTNGSETETYMAGRLSCCTSAFEHIDLDGRQEELTDSLERMMRFRVPIGYDDDQLDGLTAKSRWFGCANARPANQDVVDSPSISDPSAAPLHDTAVAILESAPSISSIFTVSARSVDAAAALQAPVKEECEDRDIPTSLSRRPRRSVTAIERLRGLVGIGIKRLV